MTACMVLLSGLVHTERHQGPEHRPLSQATARLDTSGFVVSPSTVHRWDASRSLAVQADVPRWWRRPADTTAELIGQDVEVDEDDPWAEASARQWRAGPLLVQLGG